MQKSLYFLNYFTSRWQRCFPNRPNTHVCNSSFALSHNLTHGHTFQTTFKRMKISSSSYKRYDGVLVFPYLLFIFLYVLYTLCVFFSFIVYVSHWSLWVWGRILFHCLCVSLLPVLLDVWVPLFWVIYENRVENLLRAPLFSFGQTDSIGASSIRSL